MPSGSSAPPSQSSHSKRAKTDRPRRPRRQRPAKPRSFPSAPRSLPARLPPPSVTPVAPASLFLNITVEPFPGDNSPGDGDGDAQVSTPSHSGYDAAIARLDALVLDLSLTLHDKKLLDVAMKTSHHFIPTGDVHSLIHTVASSATPISELVRLAATVITGMRAFVAQSGRTGSVESAASGPRSDIVKNACATRDRSTCVVTDRRGGTSCHIIPFSVKGEKADQFWAFVAMFKGHAATEQLRLASLGPSPSSTDNIRNVLWLSPDTHSCFDRGELAIVPVVAGDGSYDPATVTEYTARIELPFGADHSLLSFYTTDDTGRKQSALLRSGHEITLRTANPSILPLPHPLLLQLHTAFTRLRKLCAAAGIPLFDAASSPSASQAASEIDYQDLLDATDSPPRFAENDGCTPPAPRTVGLPLKARFLNLLCGGEDDRDQHYQNVMHHWTAESVFTSRKREFYHGCGSESESDSGSERSRPVTEGVQRKRVWGGSYPPMGSGGSSDSL